MITISYTGQAVCGHDVNSSGWHEILAEINTIFGASGGAFAIHYFAANRGRLVYPVGIHEHFIRTYEQQFGALNPWLADRGCLDTDTGDGSHGPAWVGTARVSTMALTKTRFYRQWLEPQGLMHALFGTIGLHEQTLISMLLLRRSGDRPFDGADAAKLAVRLPLLSNLWKLQRQARASNGHALDMRVALEPAHTAIILVDQDCRIADMNERARAMIKRERVLRIRDDCFCVAGTETQRRLSELLEALFSGVSDPNERVSGGFSIRRSGNRGKLYLIASTLGRPARWRGDRRSLVALYLFDSAEQIELRADWLSDLYGFTPLESQIAMYLCQGLTLTDVASRLHASIHTVRSYMKDIFPKVGVHRQSELVGRLLQCPGVLAGGGNTAGGREPVV